MGNNYINTVIHGDTLHLLPEFQSGTAHMILSDIPYGISFDSWDILHSNTNSALGGSSPAQKNSNGSFKSRGKPINGWSEADKRIPFEYQQWCFSWAVDCYRILKPGSSCIIFAGRRFAHRATVAFEDAGFVLRDIISWDKGGGTLKAQRISKVYERRGDLENFERFQGWRVGNLRPSFEPILWFMKPYRQGGTIADNMLTNGVGAYNLDAWEKYVPDGSNIIKVSSSRDDRGMHPTQKPLKLMKALIELATSEEQLVIDPFAGSGTTLLAAQQLNRKYIGIEINEEYVNIANRRLSELPI